MRVAGTLAVALFITLAASAGPAGEPSPQSGAFPNGPEQWLMTGEEQRAWKSVRSDGEGERLIDLFWARRDPSPGTRRNEFHEDFDQRVVQADHAFGFRGKRGALTDMGRVFILLGPPKGFQQLAGKLQDTGLIAQGDPLASHEMGGKQTFEYENGNRIGLTGPVVFNENMSTHEYHYDPQRGNVAGAMATAIQRAVVNPVLKEVPAWASTRASEQVMKQSIAIGPGTKETPLPAPVVALTAGVRALALLKDVAALDPRASQDPLAARTTVSTFSNNDDLGYALSFCTARYDPTDVLSVKVGLTIAGESGGKKVRFTAPEDDLTPDAIKSLPGCYLIRGSLPMGDFGQGTYTLSVTVSDPATGQKYNREQQFKVE